MPVGIGGEPGAYLSYGVAESATSSSGTSQRRSPPSGPTDTIAIRRSDHRLRAIRVASRIGHCRTSDPE